MARLTFLGSGTSTGIPMLGCGCETCRSQDPRDARLRASVLIEDGETKVIIDTTPEFRLQCLREKVESLDAVFLTHDHADHIAGLDDIRSFTIFSKKAMPVYCHAETEKVVRNRFAYVFTPPKAKITLPKLDLQAIYEPIQIGNLMFEPLEIFHGPQPVFGYRIGKLAYLTDVNRIPEKTFERLYDLEYIIIDAVRFRPHPTHYTVEEALEIIEKLQPKKAFLTHINHDIMHVRDEADLPDNVRIAYDGLKLEFSGNDQSVIAV